MKTKLHRLLALLLTAALLLGGCGGQKKLPHRLTAALNSAAATEQTRPEETIPDETWAELAVPVYDPDTWEPTRFDDMEYHRPSLSQMEDAVQQVIDLSQEDNFDALIDAIDYYDAVFCDISTMDTLAYFYYCQDLTDQYWMEEYRFMDQFLLKADAAMEEMFMALAQSPYREDLEDDDLYFPEDFFDDYDGDAMWNEEYTALRQEEADLQAEYYDITASADANENAQDPTYYFAIYGKKLADNYVQLVEKRQEIARSQGYDNYLDYAYEEDFDRDYSPEEAYEYCLQIADELQDIYEQVMDRSYEYGSSRRLTAEDNLQALEDLTDNLGGIFEEAFDLMTENGLYDIAPDESKFPGSYCTYLDNYHEPLLFIDPEGYMMDKMTLTHEFGHFTDACMGDGLLSGIDVAEIFSQALEYLSLEYGEDMQSLKIIKLADCMDCYMFQGMLAAFEYEVYHLDDEDLTVENMTEIFADLCMQFDLDFLPEMFYTQVPHFYEAPGYVISYVVSNDLALQIYEQELAQPGAGVELYEEFIGCNASHIVELAEEMGLESPFAADRLLKIRLLMIRQVLK